MTRREDFWSITLVFFPWFYTFVVVISSFVQKANGSADNTANTAFVLFWIIFGFIAFIAIGASLLRRFSESFRAWWLESSGSLYDDAGFPDINSVTNPSTNSINP